LDVKEAPEHYLFVLNILFTTT